MKRYRHLFFDLDNTVWDFTRNSRHALEETFEAFQLQNGLVSFCDFNRVYNEFNDKLWELYRQNGITKQELMTKRFDHTFEELGIRGVDSRQFNDGYLSRMPLQTRLCDGAEMVLRTLAGRYELYVITNGFTEVQHKKLENSGIDRFFRKVFISEVIKAPKPDPEIFFHALKSSNARKRESLMIGDSWEIDVLGAMQVGLDQVHYAPGLELCDFTAEELAQIGKKQTLTRRINNLAQLLEWL